jgi:hypothetical protein
MLEQFEKRIDLPTFSYRLEIFSDGNDDYTIVLPEYFRKDTINYGQLMKIKKSGRVVDKVRRIIYGNPHREAIETTDVENFNGILRERIGRIVRKTKCYAKDIDCLTNAIGLFQFYWNFMHTMQGRTMTPAIEENIATKIWTWGNLLHYRIKVS